MKIGKLILASLILIGLGLSCVMAFGMIGSRVDADGFLHEPFFLVPMGWLFVLLGLLVGAIGIAGRLCSRIR